MTQRERMNKGLPYKCWMDGLAQDRMENKKRISEYNAMRPECQSEIRDLLKKILGRTGERAFIEAPFHCDYGYNIEVGENFFANYGFTVLDVGKVKIGDNVQIAPNVSIYTAGHPIHPDSRNSGYEYGLPVTIGNNVWIWGSSVILPNVTIGDNAVIGAGSVVVSDIPADTVAVGNPCRVIREIGEEDRKFYYKRYEFDVDDYNDFHDAFFACEKE